MVRVASLSRLLLVAGALLAAPDARAQVIGFSASDPSWGNTSTSFARGAYTIDFTPASPVSYGFFLVANAPFCGPPCTDNGQYNLYAFNQASLRLSGGPSSGFSLLSIDAAQTFTTLNVPLDLMVTGHLVGGGSVTAHILTAPGAADVFQTFTLPDSFVGLSSVEMESQPVYYGTFPWPQWSFAINDFTVAPTPTATVTPEPATVVLFAGGLLALVGVARRRTMG